MTLQGKWLKKYTKIKMALHYAGSADVILIWHCKGQLQIGSVIEIGSFTSNQVPVKNKYTSRLEDFGFDLWWYFIV